MTNNAAAFALASTLFAGAGISALPQQAKADVIGGTFTAPTWSFVQDRRFGDHLEINLFVTPPAGTILPNNGSFVISNIDQGFFFDSSVGTNPNFVTITDFNFVIQAGEISINNHTIDSSDVGGVVFAITVQDGQFLPDSFYFEASGFNANNPTTESFYLAFKPLGSNPDRFPTGTAISFDTEGLTQVIGQNINGELFKTGPDPVPLPPAALLLGSAVAALGMAARRRTGSISAITLHV